MHGVREIAASRSASELMTDEQLGEGSLTLEAEASSGGLEAADLWQHLEGTVLFTGVQSPSVLEALAEPAVDLLERAAEFFGAEGCGQPFYDGTLAHPLNDD